MFYPYCSTLTVLFLLFYSYSFYSYCSILNVLLFLFYSYCSTLTVLPLLFYSYCSTLTVLLLLFYSYCSTLSVLLLLFYSYCSTLTVLFLLFYSFCSTLTVLLLLESVLSSSICSIISYNSVACISTLAIGWPENRWNVSDKKTTQSWRQKQRLQMIRILNKKWSHLVLQEFISLIGILMVKTDFIVIKQYRPIRDHIVFGFTTTYAISTYHPWSCGFESRAG
jgi:hypothetical protein